MLRLKRVEIQGFKSFYDRTEMKFSGSGIAAIVGPNGCGKSNLSDAISWVLGEQSAKTLRGARMEDVIFAGTRDKRALGMASVTMTLVPDRAALAASAVSAPENAIPPSKDTEATTEKEAPSKAEALEPKLAERGDGQPLEATGEATDPNEAAAPIAEPAARSASILQASMAHRSAERSGEITITRRLYRSGDSEYLINGKTARLRDIQELFLGTGLGPESYAIIEQGRIGQILSNRPQDRRNVIEEAAGITRFKTRKRMAEAKLESAKQNLSRVFDILEEVTRQANSLKRQAAKTKRYGELKAESTGYLRQLLAAKFALLEREMAKIAIELNLASAELEQTQGGIAEREGQQGELLEASYGNEGELTIARKQLADLRLEAERTRGRLEYQTKQVARISEALVSGERELESLGSRHGERVKELEVAVEELAAADETYRSGQEELTAKAAERQQAQGLLAEQERGLEANRQKVLRLLGESSGLRNRITQVEAQLATSDRDVSRARNEEEQSLSDLQRIEQLKGQLSEQLASRQTDLVSLGEQRKTVEGEWQRRRSELNDSRASLDRLKGEVSRIRARRESLENVIQHRSYTTETVKRLFTAVERNKTEEFRPLGVLADFLEVDPQLEKAAEEFLHDELEFVVVRDWAEGERGIELLRGDLNGRGTFLVESASAPAQPVASIPGPACEPGKLSRLTDSLRWSNGLSQMSMEQLPRIANCYVAEERATARDLATSYPHCWFLTPEGVNFHGQAISGGKKSGAGPLALKRELRDLIKTEQTKQGELETLEGGVRGLERSISELAEEIDQLRSRQQMQEKDVLALDHESRKLAEELGRVKSRLSHARIELDRIGRDRVQLEGNLERDRQALAEKEDLRHEEEEALEAARDQLSGLRAELARLNEEHASMRATQASLEERRRSLSNGQTRLETQLRELANRHAHLVNESERMSGEKTALAANNSELQSTLDQVRTAIGEAETVVENLARREAELRTQLAEAEEQLKLLRQTSQQQQEQRSERQVAFARTESQLKHLEDLCAQELNTSAGELVKSFEDSPDLESVESLEAQYTEAKRRIEALGPVNPTALEEFEEAQQRHEFLSAQRQDLLDSIRDTERAIGEIDNESRKRFAEAFHAINANFKEMFTTLFGGGTGEMRLTDEENLAESGVDIVASPPGKRLQSVLLLSGGEKSLTAMALLMSVFQYSPSPFCVLDEIDAPLDELNIERLTRLLREMSQDTQFIVITHAKRTMEAAQSLYGVTMQEPGVSRLVSVRFNPASENALGALRAEPARNERFAAVSG